MPTQARVEIKRRENGLYELIVDGVDVSQIVSADNFRIDWVDRQPVVSLQLVPGLELTADLPDAVLRLADSQPDPDASPDDEDAGSGLVAFLAEMRRDLDVLLARTRPPAAEQPRRCALLVALNEDDANYWWPIMDKRRVALTTGSSPLRSPEGLRVTEVHVTPRAAEGERYRRIMDTVRQSLRLLNVDPQAAINYLHEDSAER